MYSDTISLVAYMSLWRALVALSFGGRGLIPVDASEPHICPFTA